MLTVLLYPENDFHEPENQPNLLEILALFLSLNPKVCLYAVYI